MLRAGIVLACAEGRSNTAVAARLRVNRTTTVTKWRAQSLARRLDGLGDESRPGVPRNITDAQVAPWRRDTPEGATHWSKRELARDFIVIVRLFVNRVGWLTVIASGGNEGPDPEVP